MPPSRKEGPPQASPTSLASSSSAASPSRGKEPPQVEAHICMNTSGPHKDTKRQIFESLLQNTHLVYFSIGHQCFHAVSTHCILLVLFGSIVRLRVIMLYIQHPTHPTVWAADIPQCSSGPICLQSSLLSLLLFVCSSLPFFFFFLGWLRPLLLNCVFPPFI